MMLRHPEAIVVKPLGVPGELSGMEQRLPGVTTLDNGCEVKDR